MRAVVAILASTLLAACGQPVQQAAAPTDVASATAPTDVATEPTPTDAATEPRPTTAPVTAPADPAAPTGPTPATAPPPLPLPLVRCSNLPPLEAPEAWYRDSPVYTGNEQPYVAVRDWAQAQPGFQEIWIGREHFGWLTVAFTGDVAARNAELQAQFPNDGVVAVEAPSTLAELDALQAQVVELLEGAGIEFGGLGTYVTNWSVGIDVDASDERLIAALAPVSGERICINDTGPVTPEGPQPEGGDGWRLLGDELVGETYRTGIATDEAQYEQLWRQVGMAGERPPVDFQSEVVVWFGGVYGSTCPIRLDDVIVVGGNRPFVHGKFVVPGGTGVCTADANPHAFFVALERVRLPGGPFAIQLDEADPPSGVPEERTLVGVDLSEPGAVAGPADVGPDPELLAAAGQQPPVSSGATIEPGFPSSYAVGIHCGVEWLGKLNGITWRAAETDGVGDFMPPEWASSVDESAGRLVVEVLMTEGPAPTLTATAGGRSVVYLPADGDDEPFCS